MSRTLKPYKSSSRWELLFQVSCDTLGEATKELTRLSNTLVGGVYSTALLYKAREQLELVKKLVKLAEGEMTERYSSIAEELDELLPEGWEHNAYDYGWEFTLTCPCGREIEQDGECPIHGNPLKEMGYV